MTARQILQIINKVNAKGISVAKKKKTVKKKKTTKKKAKKQAVSVKPKRVIDHKANAIKAIQTNFNDSYYDCVSKSSINRMMEICGEGGFSVGDVIIKQQIHQEYDHNKDEYYSVLVCSQELAKDGYILPARYSVFHKEKSFAYAAPIKQDGTVDYRNWICLNDHVMNNIEYDEYADREIEGCSFIPDKDYVDHILLNNSEPYSIADAIKRDLAKQDQVIDDFRMNANMGYRSIKDENDAYRYMNEVITAIKNKCTSPHSYFEYSKVQTYYNKPLTIEDIADAYDSGCGDEIFGELKTLQNVDNKYLKRAKGGVRSAFRGIKFDESRLESFIRANPYYLEYDDSYGYDDENVDNIYSMMSCFTAGMNNECWIFFNYEDLEKWQEHNIMSRIGYASVKV